MLHIVFIKYYEKIYVAATLVPRNRINTTHL